MYIHIVVGNYYALYGVDDEKGGRGWQQQKKKKLKGIADEREKDRNKKIKKSAHRQ